MGTTLNRSSSQSLCRSLVEQRPCVLSHFYTTWQCRVRLHENASMVNGVSSFLSGMGVSCFIWLALKTDEGEDRVTQRRECTRADTPFRGGLNSAAVCPAILLCRRTGTWLSHDVSSCCRGLSTGTACGLIIKLPIFRY